MPNSIGYFMKDAGKDLISLASDISQRIKSDNIVIDPITTQAKLIDFGLSYKFQDLNKAFHGSMFATNPPFLSIHNKETFDEARQNINLTFLNYKEKNRTYYRELEGKLYAYNLIEQYGKNIKLIYNPLNTILKKLKKIDVFGLGYTFIWLLSNSMDIFTHRNQLDPRIKKLLLGMTNMNPINQYDIETALLETPKIMYPMQHPAPAPPAPVAQVSPHIWSQQHVYKLKKIFD